MGLLSFLFSSAADKPGTATSYAELMAYGKRQLFAGKSKEAAEVFSRAAAAAPQNPLPLAYRSWAGRLDDKSRALTDSEEAVDLGPHCAEAHMSLALAHATGYPDFEQAAMAFFVGAKNPPEDAYGSVLSIGVFLVFVDVFASLREDADGFNYDFQPTPLRNAADWLLCGHYAAAHEAFRKIYKSGREVEGALGMAATSWAMRDRASTRTFAKFLLASGVVKDLGILAAISYIRDTAQQ